MGCTVSHTIGPQEIEDEIDEGRPVVIAVVAKGTYRKPFGLTYYVCIYGYSKDSWLLHDPCGRLDLKNGLWESTLEVPAKESNTIGCFQTNVFFMAAVLAAGVI